MAAPEKAVADRDGTGPQAERCGEVRTESGAFEAADVSDCESGVSGGAKDWPAEILSGGGGGSSGLIRVSEEDKVHTLIKQRFLSCLQQSGDAAHVVAIHRRSWSAALAQANLMAFQIYLRALTQKNSGNANVRFTWFGTSKAGIEKIITHGFSHEEIKRSPDVVYGRGVHLSSDDCPIPRFYGSKWRPGGGDSSLQAYTCRMTRFDLTT